MPLIPIAIVALLTGSGFAFGNSFKDTFDKFFWLILAGAAAFLVWKFIL